MLYGIQVDVPIGNFCRCFWSDTFNNTLFKCPWSDDQPVRYVCGDADERRGPYAVTQDDTPLRVVILEKSELGRAHQKTADDEQEKERADGDPADPPKPPRAEAEHFLHVTAELSDAIKPVHSHSLYEDNGEHRRARGVLL